MSATPKTIGKYRVVRAQGQGGFATVYRALDDTLGREVALKALHTSLTKDPTFVQRFRHEARLVAQLFHPNIVPIFEIGEQDEQLYIAYRFIQGTSLREWMQKKGTPPLRQVVDIVRQVGEALDYAHASEIIHRDIKPANILVQEDGQIFLTDFGIARAVEGTRFTQTGGIVGTPEYMSPEQAESAELDWRTDLYSLGVVAYEMCTGKVPFSGTTPVSTCYMHAHQPPPLPSTLHARAQEPVERVLLKILSKDPQERYQSGRELAQALREAVEELENQVVPSLLAKARQLLQGDQVQQAQDYCQQVLAIHPDHADATAIIVEAQQQATLSDRYTDIVGHVEAARAVADEILTARPNHPDPQGVIALLRGKSTVAVRPRPREPVRVEIPGSLIWLGAGALLVIAGLLVPWNLITADRRIISSWGVNTLHHKTYALEHFNGIPWVALVGTLVVIAISGVGTRLEDTSRMVALGLALALSLVADVFVALRFFGEYLGGAGPYLVFAGLAVLTLGAAFALVGELRKSQRQP